MSVPLESWDSKNLLLNHIAKCPRSIVIGVDVEAPRAYYSCSIANIKNPIQVGIVVNQTSTPAVLLLPGSCHLLIGHDQSVSVVDIGSAELQSTSLLEGVFFEFLRDDVHSQMLAVHELGVVAVSKHGEVLWRYITSDILEDWIVAGDCLSLTVTDGDTPLVLSLCSGAPV